MEPYPGERILSGQRVPVIGLVHVPEEGDVQPYHGVPLLFNLMKI
jgi:hypothetical protein